MRVLQTYERYLGREATPSEIAYWVDRYHHGATNEDIVTGFLAADEYFAGALSPTDRSDPIFSQIEMSPSGSLSAGVACAAQASVASWSGASHPGGRHRRPTYGRVPPRVVRGWSATLV